MNHLPSYFGIYLFSYLIARCLHCDKAIRSIIIHLVTMPWMWIFSMFGWIFEFCVDITMLRI